MNEIQYIGEHLWPQRFGHFSLILGFIGALLSAFAYYKATQTRGLDEEAGWRSIGRWSFVAQGMGIFAVIGVIFYIMLEQYFEYQYVWAHVSEELPFKYIFAAFWEGQEGSFLLWMFWHVVLGIVLIFKAGKWEAPVISVLALVQAFILSMIMGIYLGFGDFTFKLGSNPLMLLRETMDAPIFAKADYLEMIKGNGLNPLLQNYWMTIHPPTLFLGFASTTIPFAYAIAGLWTREHKAWLQPALPWALFSGAILGTGILMGGAWAYEALSFGGYWAWDPVENMSLVPWLILLAGIHTNLIAKASGYSIRSTYFFYLFTFVLIVYSTFLTRSGVLGETSVHAFTEMGLEWQLIAFIGVFTLLSLVLFFVRYKDIPAPKKEEAVASKEFWMFIGTLVLLFSALIITASTSLPVYNKIMTYFDPAFEGRVITDPVPHYNKYQLWIGVFIGLLSGFSQYLRWREQSWQKQARKFAIHAGVAAAITLALCLLTAQWIDLRSWQYSVLLFTGIFAVVTNLDYLIMFTKTNLKVAGSVASHIGFGLMIVGILASGLNQKTISSNPFVMDGLIQGADAEQLRKNILLFQGEPMFMSGYEVTYVKDTVDTYTRTYTLNFKQKNEAGDITEEFTLYPNVLYDKSFTKIAASNPSTKRYLHKDIFTHIASLPQVEMDMDFRQQREDSLNYKPYRAKTGQALQVIDTVEIRDQNTAVERQFTFEVLSIDRQPVHPDYEPEEGDLAVGATIRVQRSDDDSTYIARPVIVLRGQLLYSYPHQINPLSSKVRLNEGIFEQVFTLEDELDYESFKLKQGETINFAGAQITFERFNRQPNHPAYIKQEGDLPVSAELSVRTADGEQYALRPLFLIREGSPLNLKDELSELGLHARFTMIDPKTEQAQLFFAQKDGGEQVIPFEVATDSLRSDYIVLEAIEFPGINFFWLGSTMMMLGLTLSMVYRIMNRRS